MKIGILTYHRAENYGALLQSYALMTYFKRMGYEVSFVDYWPKYHEEYFKLFPLQQLKHWKVVSKLKFLVKLSVWYIPRIIRKKRMQRFMRERLNVTKDILYRETDRTEPFDIVVYGSDQIWRKQNLCGVGFDSWYFGANNVLAKKKIVYAGSMGTIDTTTCDDEYVKQMLSNFSCISVRENDLQIYLKNMEISAPLMIDPVFLLSQEQWRKVECKKGKSEEKYIFFYNLLNTSESRCFAERLSKKKKLPIKEVNKTMSFRNIGKRYIFTASVEKFLQLIDEAEFVVSNSFHGVAMSIIFEKQFFAVGMGNRANRVNSLLNNLGIGDRYVDENFQLYSREIDYEQVGIKLRSLKLSSEKYLTNSLG